MLATTLRPRPSRPYVSKISAQANGSQVLSLADFLIGCTQQAQIVRGDTRALGLRQQRLRLRGRCLSANPSLNVNYGVRYDYLGPNARAVAGPLRLSPHDLRCRQRPRLPGWRYQLALPQDLLRLQPPRWLCLSADASVRALSSVVVLACSLIQPNLNPFLDNRPPNGGASGAESNPGGPAPVSSLSNSNIVIITPRTLLFPRIRHTTPTPTTTSSPSAPISAPLIPSTSTSISRSPSAPRPSSTLAMSAPSLASCSPTSTSTRPPLGSTPLGTTAQNATRPYGKQFPIS